MSVSSFSFAVADGVFRADPSALPTETVLPGLKLGLVMSGRFGLTVDGGRDLDIAGPAICLLVALRLQRFLRFRRLQLQLYVARQRAIVIGGGANMLLLS